MNQVPVDNLLTERDLAVYLGLSLPTLQRMRAAGTGPQFVQLSQRRIAYRRSAVDAWLAGRTTDRIGGVDLQRSSQRPVTAPLERDTTVSAAGQVA
jgi:predicted DNA-binding transcriptional regulator AlpA